MNNQPEGATARNLITLLSLTVGFLALDLNLEGDGPGLQGRRHRVPARQFWPLGVVPDCSGRASQPAAWAPTRHCALRRWTSVSLAPSGSCPGRWAKNRVSRREILGTARPFPYSIQTSRFRAHLRCSHSSSVSSGAVRGFRERVYASSGIVQLIPPPRLCQTLDLHACWTNSTAGGSITTGGRGADASQARQERL